MTNLSYATNCNIKRFQNLLDTSVDATGRETLQRLIIAESKGS
jgi:hypothetical protein